MSVKGNESRVRTCLSNEQKSEIVQKIKEGVSKDQITKEYKISITTYYKIKHSAENIIKLTQQITTLRKIRFNKYEDLEERFYKWFEERKESGDNFSEFDDEGLKLMDEFCIPSTSAAKKKWVRECKKRFENLYQLKCRKTLKSTQNLAQESDQIELPAEKFIRELINRLQTEQIKRDNIYFMFKTTFTWKSLLSKTEKDEKEIDIQQKLRGDGLTTLLCTNVTGRHKLTPFYYYEYKTQEFLKYLKSPVDLIYTSKKDKTKHQQIFTDWYNNHFMKFVRERQQEKNVSGKVFLFVYNCKFIHPEDIMQNDDFELIFPSIYEKYCKLNTITFHIRKNIPGASKVFCRFYNMSIYIKTICESWTKISSTYIKSVLDKFLPDYHTKVNTTSSPLVKQTSKLIQNVTEEDSALKVITAKSELEEFLRFKQESTKRSIGEDTEEEHVSPKVFRLVKEIGERSVNPEDLTEFLDPYEEDEGKECQKQESTKRSIGEDTEEHVSPKNLRLMNEMDEMNFCPDNMEEMNFYLENLALFLDSYEKDEGKEYQEQENDRNNVEI